MEPLVCQQPITLAGAGPLTGEELIAARQLAPEVVAVDGGADRVMELGVKPVAVVGDLDSLASQSHWRERGITVVETPDQNATDLEKCLDMVQAPLAVGVGFLGGRLDHSLAALGQVLRRRHLVLLHDSELIFAPGRQWRCSLPRGTRLSIHASRKLEVISEVGLRWPAAGLRLYPGTTRGISNVADSEFVSIAFSRRGALIVTELERLANIVESLGVSPN